MIDVLYIHGLEGGPNSKKPTYLRTHKNLNVHVPALNHKYNIPRTIWFLIDEIIKIQPDVIVASSYGASLTIFLIQLGIWKGNTILMSCAIQLMGRYRMWLPDNYPGNIIFIHGLYDTLCPISAIREFSRYHYVSIIEQDDDHRLNNSISIVPALIKPNSHIGQINIFRRYLYPIGMMFHTLISIIIWYFGRLCNR